MVPTKQNVFDAVRARLGDDAVAGGQVYTNTAQEQHFQTAFRELIRAMQITDNPRIHREAYYNLPAYTSYLDPATAGLFNFSSIEDVYERGNITQAAITNAVPGSALLTLTAPAHGLGGNPVVVVYLVGGISDDVNDVWMASVVDANTLTLNGCTSTGVYTSGGVVSYSADVFDRPMEAVDEIDDVMTPNSFIRQYAWRGGAFRFQPCNTVRQLKIVYDISGNPPVSTSASIGIDDSLDFLAFRTAGLVASAKRATQRATEMNQIALGPTYFQDGTIGGLLYELLNSAVRAEQAVPMQRPPYRYRRFEDGYNSTIY